MTFLVTASALFMAAVSAAENSNAPDLPNFQKPPYYTLLSNFESPSIVHPEWPPMPWHIFITSGTKKNNIAVFDDGISINYAEWAVDTDHGVVYRGYWYINNKFVFDKEVPLEPAAKIHD